MNTIEEAEQALEALIADQEKRVLGLHAAIALQSRNSYSLRYENVDLLAILANEDALCCATSASCFRLIARAQPRPCPSSITTT